MSSMDNRKLLVVEDDLGLRKQLRWALDDFDVAVAEDRPSAIAAVRKEPPTVVVLDLGLPPDPNGASEGLATLTEILTLQPATKVIIASGNEDRNYALQAISQGAYDFYPKPVDSDVLKLIVERAMHVSALEADVQRLRQLSARATFGGIQTADQKMLEICRLVERVATSDVSVLINGESGTGKEVLARALHEASPRAKGPLVAINCAAIPGDLLESELFGHEKGSFTGAHKQQIGKFEQADQGTLFLDEIGDMPLTLQAKLLRFVQDRVVERLGGRQGKKVDVRIVSATNQDLTKAIEEKRFREDLYFRLDEVGVMIPPLRERSGDAVLLAKYFLQKFSNEDNKKVVSIAPETIALIDSYPWPGNVRELENRMKRAMVLAEGGSIRPADMGLQPDEEAMGDFPTLKQTREKAERDLVTRALQVAGHNISNTAKLLGVSRPTLYDLLKTLGINQHRESSTND